MADIITLPSASILRANFDLLEPNFSFIVNGQVYQTHKFGASLLSPIVTNLLLADKSLDSFEIQTKNSQGDFQLLLNLISFGEQVIDNQDKEFILEIFDILQIDCVHVELKSRLSKITYENVFSNLLNDLQHPHYYHEIIEEELRIIAENMYRILCNDEERRHLSELDITIIERILNHDHLIIESENQLLDFINSLYLLNNESSNLYQYVDFLYCDSTHLKTFFDVFSIEDINETIWYQMKERFEYSIELKSNTRKGKHSLKSNQPFDKIEFSKGTNDFDGIINHLRKQPNQQIENEITITASSVNGNNVSEYGPYRAIQYDNQKAFYSQDQPNSWICFEFKNHRIIPTHYTIQSCRGGGYAPINFKIEILNDKLEWEEIDRQKEVPFRYESLKTLTFSINENHQKETRFIRLTQTGKNSNGGNQLIFNSIEFFGYLI